ncbi:MAG TPA: gamma-glutamyl-gamma-aminobutyrate hydrolase family protein [Solirubrobacteraceae bacterium]|nr:gamma-glutamyl-gamma-aminobutyrate hydrolase family protein [Solirubrobacteraceae bacterium]
MSSGPLIGISASVHDFGDYAGVGVQRPVLAAGGIPVTLSQLTAAVDRSLDALDGLVLAPGRDIEPWRYGARAGPLLAAVEPRRDEFELALVPAALKRGLPVLGMCRGLQVLNVARGGTLFEDVSLVAPGHATDPGWVAWKQTEIASLADAAPPPHPRHQVDVAPGSTLAGALRETSVEVNSYHHQAIDRLGDGLTVVARAPDGVIEAVEIPGRPVLAVQWELQEEARVDPRSAAVFSWFVEAARAHSLRDTKQVPARPKVAGAPIAPLRGH